MTLQRFSAGETVLDIGQVPQAIFFVLRGTAGLVVPLGDGGQLPVARVEAVDYLGQTALTRETLLTSAVALTELAVLCVPVSSLDGLVPTKPRLAREFGEVIERRRAQASAAIKDAPPLAIRPSA